MAGVDGARIILGVSGGIAAYKAVDVCRRLVDAGAHVVPVLTDGALRFIGRTTFDALGSERAWTSLWDEDRPIPHTHLGQSADLVLVAPATARVLGLYRAGISEDLLQNVLLATRAPVVVCPAMHTEMWEHPAVQENLAVLRSRGVHVVPPGVGRLAGGDVGAGRLAEPAEIVAAVEEVLATTAPAAGRPQTAPASNDLAGLRVLVTAGGTREPIDPVRFIGNRSSGKQGHAVAAEALLRGAEVTLVTTTRPQGLAEGAEVVRVETAAEMEDAVLSRSDKADVVVMAAAVADFRPARAADRKLKKADGAPEIVLEPTTDILAALGQRRRSGQVIVGFAAETDDLRANAAEKLTRKGVDLIVANDVSAPGVGFEHDTNAVVILDAAGGAVEVPLSDKRAIARSILDAVIQTRSDQ
jgi:phosphopantothenoylcysteine decarboxylase/phosphopantothenate--cysteine ligase